VKKRLPAAPLGVYDFVSIRSLTQEDPIGLAGGLNLYGFAAGDPVNFSDPFGLCVWDVCIVEFVLAATAAVAAVRAAANYLTDRPIGEGVLADANVAFNVATLVAPVGPPVGRVASTATEGTTVYRVFGGEAKAMGRSWTPTNPGSVSDFRSAAGLPTQNTGQFVAEGVLTSATGVAVTTARAGAGGAGGLAEFVVPNAAMHIRLVRVSGVNPPF